MIKRFLAIFLTIVASSVQAQDKEPPKPRPVIAFGLKAEGGYIPNYWSHFRIGNFPEEFRKVIVPNKATRYNNAGFTHIFEPGQDNLEVKTIGWLLPLHVGPTINIGEIFEVSGGGTLTFNPKGSNRMQEGCYCSGSTVTYVEMESAPAIIGLYAETTLRVAGPVWLSGSASFYPMWRDIGVKQGYSEYGGDYTVLKKDFGGSRIPLILLFGLKFAPGKRDDDGFLPSFSFRAGFGHWETRINPEYAGMTHPGKQRSFLVGVFGEYNQLFGKKKK